MKSRTTLIAFGLIAALAGCGESGSDTTSDAQRAADQLTGDATGAAADNPLCKLFTAEELEAYVGEPLNGPRNAAMGSGCQWPAKDDDGDVMLQVIPASYHANPRGAEGYREIPDLGPKSYVVFQLQSWLAATLVGDESVMAAVAGQGASPEKAEALLRETLKRRAK